MAADSNTAAPTGWKTVVFFAAGLVAGFKPLADPDLGWHLAGGLWMLEKQRVVSQDFLAVGSAKWTAYSWLFEVAVGAVFRTGGFHALVALQALSVALCCAVLSWSIDCFSGDRGWSRPGVLLCTVLTGAAMLFASPICQLRPQLYSLLFVVYVVTRLCFRRMSLFETAVLTVIWANVHVFWILSPLFYLILAERGNIRRRIIGASLLGLCGMVSPYGIENYGVLVEYAFQHSAGYGLISEFQALSGKQGLIMLMFLVTAGAAAFAGKRAVQRSVRPLAAAYLLFAAAAILQIKYLPIAGYLSVALLAAIFGEGSSRRDTALSIGQAAVCVVMSLGVWFIPFREPLPRKYTELFSTAARLV